MIDTDVAIETPEHIVFRHRIAGPARRMFAQIIDLILCYGAVLLVAVIVVLAMVGQNAISSALEGTAKAGVGVLLLVIFAAQWVYFVAWEAMRGTTPGKMALGLRVVTTEGRPIGLVEASLRNLLRAADALPVAFALGFVPVGYVLGTLAIALSPRFQRLGDLVAGTIVIIPDRARATAPVALWPPARPEEWRDVPEAVQLDADERAAIELFLRRRGTLGAAREQELADMVAEPILRRHGMDLGGRAPEAARALALLYERAQNAGRTDAPPSSRAPASGR